MRTLNLIVVLWLGISYSVFAQKRGEVGLEKIRFEEVVDPETGIKSKKIRVNYLGMDIPLQTNQYAQLWAQPNRSFPNAQANQLLTLTSFIEVEGNRLTNTKSDLSWTYLLYFSLLESCRDYIESHGKHPLNLIPDFKMALRVVKTYGILPVNVYPIKLKDNQQPDFKQLRIELSNYLLTVKSTDSWLESTILATVRSILNHHLGEPTNRFMFGRIAINPVEFLRSTLGFYLEKYVMVSSDLAQPFWRKRLLSEALATQVYNIPLDFYTAILNNGIQTGYPAIMQADVDDAGFDHLTHVAIVPSFGLGQLPLDGPKRQYHHDYKKQAEDQPLLLVGYKQHQNQTWYLTRYNGNLSPASSNINDSGVYIMNQDFVRINSWGYLIAKEALRDIEEDVK